MMKKINLIIVGIIAFISCTEGVSATNYDIDGNSCSISIIGKNKYSGYVVNEQQMICNDRSGNRHTFAFYCTDAGKSNPTELKSGSIYMVNSIGMTGILTNTNLQYFGKQVALRYYAMKTGLSKSKYQPVMQKIWNSDSTFRKEDQFKKGVESGKTAQSGVSLNRIKGADYLSLSLIDNEKNGNQFTATVSVTKLVSSIDLNSISWSSQNYNVTPQENGTKLIIEGSMRDCEGAKVTLAATFNNGLPGTDDDGTDGGNTTVILYGDIFYYYPNSSSKQTGIIYPTSSTGQNSDKYTFYFDGTNGNGTDDDSNNTTLQYEITVPDVDCDCSANISEDFSCENGNSTTKYVYETDNIKSCIITGNYTDYCGSSIEKQTDNNSSSNKEPKSSNMNPAYSVNLSDNNFCSVYCIEHIDYDLPGLIKSKNGRYFTLDDAINGSKEIKISGTRTCYTSEIKTDEFINKIKNEQQNLINYINEYNKQKALANALGEEDSYTEASLSACSYQTCTNKKLGNATSGGTYKTRVYDYEYDKVSAEFNRDGSVSSKTSEGQEDEKFLEEGRTVNNSNGTCGTASYTKSCSVTIDTDIESVVSTALTTANTAAANAKTNINTTKTKIQNLLENYKSCYEWNNNYCFEPIVEFSYEDGKIYTGANNQKLEVSESSSGDVEISMFESVSPDYTGNSSNYSIALKQKDYLYPSKNGSSYLLEEQTSNITTKYKFVKQEVKSSKTFKKPTVKVCTYHSAGTIFYENDCNATNISKNYSLLGEDGYVFPVTLQKRETRKYNYTLNFSNIGVTGNDDNCATAQANRIMGCDNSDGLYEETTEKEDSKYTCQYITEDCPDCDVECVCPDDEPNCYVEDEICKYKKCTDCIISCVGCLWSNGDTAYGYRTVSLNDVFPNTETDKVGYNWNTSNGSDIEKAKNTIDDIEDAGQEVYKTPQYSYVLTPQIMKQIREYNKGSNNGNNNNIPKGGYNSDTLSCTNGKECKSSFLNLKWMTAESVQKNRNTNWTEYESTGKSWK